MLPPDDLYARLELPLDASYEAIEIAWRALLKRHHPDIAGPEAVEVAKRINVAHDWLSDPALRDRYDQERHPRRTAPGRRGVETRSHVPPAGRGGIRREPTATRRAVRPRPTDPVQAIAQHLDRIRRLTEDELDRLSLAETAPIAFVASIVRFLPV